MKIIVVLFLILATFTLFAQTQRTPSAILNELANAEEDTVKTSLYLELGKYYYMDKYDSAYLYLNEGLKLAREKELYKNEIKLLIAKSRLIIYEGNYDDAIDTLKKVVRMAQQIDAGFSLATALNSIGVVYYNKSQYDSCKYYWSKSLVIYEEISDSSGISTINSNMGVVNYVQGNTETALNHYLKALEIRKNLDANDGMASLYMKIALIYQNHFQDNISSYNYVSEAIRLYRKENNKLGETRALMNKGNVLGLLDSAKRSDDIYKLALKNAEEIGNKRLLSGIYSTMGKNYAEKRQYKKALDYLYEARDLNIEMGQVKELGSNYRKIGDIYFKLADYNTSHSYYQKSLELFENLKLHSELSDIYYSMSQTAAKMNKFKKAFDFYQKYAEEKDSVSVHENKNLLAEMEGKYTNQKNEQKIKYLEKEQKLKDGQLEKSQIIRNLLIGIGLLVLILTLLLYQRLRQKSALTKELKKRNEEIKIANTEIKQKSSNIESFNRILVEKNSLIEKQNEEMAESNETKDRIISIIGHDLRSPMASVHTMLKLLKMKDFSKERIDHLYRLMDNDVNSAMDLLENLLIWVKKQEGRMKLQKEEQAFNPVAEKVVNSLIGIANNKEIELSYLRVEKDIACFDKPMISAVLRNLVNNAIKFTTEGGSVQISASLIDNFLQVSVTDNGIGMDQNTIDQITQKGSYYTQQGTNKEKGSGLGLSLCFDIVEMHKGVLNVESQPGKGTTFTFSIPVQLID